jgi:Recombination endonuclease VII
MGMKCEPGCQCGRHKPVRKVKYEFTCAACGKTFTAYRSDARFCSRDCWLNGKRAEVGGTPYAATKQRWAAANPEKVKEIKRRNDEKHGERYRETKRRRYAENAQELNAARSARYYADPAIREQRLAYERKRRKGNERRNYLAERGAAHGTDWVQLVETLARQQDGLCYLCGDPLQHNKPNAVHLDHDHRCHPTSRSCAICRRGLACNNCNVLIGRALDDPDRLRRIADNLERALAEVDQRMAEADGQLFA